MEPTNGTEFSKPASTEPTPGMSLRIGNNLLGIEGDQALVGWIDVPLTSPW